jgi:hypothetical protein
LGRRLSAGLGIPNPSGLLQPAGLSGRVIGDVEPSEGGTVGVLTWKADSSTTQQIALMRTQVGREQLLSLVLGRRGTVAGLPEETCLDAGERCFLGKES